MTMSSGDRNGLSSQINVTPMIDVLLVLLIIFMVIAPAVPKGEAVLAPKPGAHDHPGEDAVVLEVLRGAGGQAAFRVNRRDVSLNDLQAQLEQIYAKRAQRVLFVKGDGSLSFTQIAQAVDIGHAAGADRIGLLTAKTPVSE